MNDTNERPGGTQQKKFCIKRPFAKQRQTMNKHGGAPQGVFGKSGFESFRVTTCEMGLAINIKKKEAEKGHSLQG